MTENNSHTYNKKHFVLGIFVALFIISMYLWSSHQAYADEFLKMPIRVKASPTVCAVEPEPNANFPKIGSQLLDKTESAILDWKLKLNAAAGKHPIWNINLIRVPIGQEKSFDYTKCDITIHFLPKTLIKGEEFALDGIT